MGGTIVWLTIPFTFALEGRYEVSIDKKNVRIDINFVQNDEAVNQIMGIVSHGQRQIMPDDPEGMVNISSVIIEFPFEYSDAHLEGEGTEKLTQIQHLCVVCLNRLKEAISYHTNRYWLRSVAPYHLNIYRLLTYNDAGHGKHVFIIAPPSANFFPLTVREYRNVKQEVSRMLRDETPIPLHDKLYMDALNFFHFFSFAEAIITANTALEVFVRRHLAEKYVSEDKSVDEAREMVKRIFRKGIQKGMKKTYFKTLDEGKGDKHQVLQKLEEVREARANAVHFFSKSPSSEEAKDVLFKVSYIINWISKQSSV